MDKKAITSFINEFNKCKSDFIKTDSDTVNKWINHVSLYVNSSTIMKDRQNEALLNSYDSCMKLTIDVGTLLDKQQYCDVDNIDQFTPIESRKKRNESLDKCRNIFQTITNELLNENTEPVLTEVHEKIDERNIEMMRLLLAENFIEDDDGGEDD